MNFFRLICYCCGISFLFSLTNCRKHSFKTEDPCNGNLPLSSDFRVEESFKSLSTVWPYYGTDTVAISLLRFTATDSLATSYEWHIGSGVYFTRSFQLEFPDAFLKQHESIPVTLIVKGKPNAACFPIQDSVKSITKNIFFTDSTLVSGAFYGYFENNAADKFKIEIDPKKPCSDVPGGTNYNTVSLSILNLVKGCETLSGTCFGGQYKIGYKQILFTSSSCQSPGGTIKIGPDNNEVTIDYSVYENGYQQPAVHKKFIGTRIH